MLTTGDGRPTNAILGFLQMLLGSIEKFNPDAIVCSLESESPTFRHAIDATYKANRKSPDDELKVQIGEIINLIGRLNIQTLFTDKYEADDVIGSFAHSSQDDFDQIEIVTGDRDLLQLLTPKVHVFLPGRNFSDLIDYDREKFKEKFGIELEDFVLYKALIGDASDNIKGVPGIGPKTAANIVNKFHSVDSILANLDELPSRVAEAITENADGLKRCYELCKIETNLKIDLKPEDIKTSKINASALRKIVEEFELKSMAKRVAKFIDNFEKKYGGFSLFDDGDDSQPQSSELDYNLTDKVNFDGNKAFVIATTTDYRIGDGKVFEEVPKSVLYNFVILKKLKCFIGFDLKGFIKDLTTAGIENITDYEFIDMKLAWHLIQNALTFENINEIAAHLKTPNYQEILSKTEEEIKKFDMDKLFELEKKLEIVLADMELTGVDIDENYLKQLEGEYKDKIQDIKQKIFDCIGHEFNPASTKELGHILFDVLKLPVFKKNKTGFSTDDNTLTKLMGMHEVIPLIKEFRLYSKILSTYIIGLQNSISLDGKIHTTLRQDQVATGRLSSINPNLQNLPADELMGGQIRGAFKAENGVFLSLDYSQIELRVLAQESNDPRLVEAFKNGEDIHTSTARVIFEKEEINKKERNFAKIINFGIVFGMEPYGLSQALSIDQKEAKAFIEKYLTEFAGVKEYFDRITKQLDEKGYVNTFMNRRRYFPAWARTNGFQKRMLFREAINMPIQGGESEIIKDAMVKIFSMIKKDKLESKLLLQIHDELIFWVKNEKLAKEYAEKFKAEMENVVKWDVPIKAEFKIGKNLSFS
jgi:DNA polymerase-1